jgi:D-amino-acid dehydrogenase
MSRRVVVIGGGVIGLASALSLLKRGHRVLVVERGMRGHDCCSLGNSGYISPSHFVPLAAPGVVSSALRWMGDPRSPLYVTPRFDLEWIVWAWRFWRASTARRAESAGPCLRDLLVESRALFEEIATAAGDEIELRRDGLLSLFESEAAWDAERRHAERARALGMPAEVVDPAGVAALEPEMTFRTVGGVLYPLDAHVTPHRLHAALTRLVLERGGEFAWGAEASGWRAEGRTVRAVRTAVGEIEADEFVAASGAWTARLLRPLGLRLSLMPGKGYSLTLPAPRERPRRSVLLQEARVAVTPMGDSLRVGGTMEIGAFGAGIHPPRIEGIVRSFTRAFPAFTPADFAAIPPWSGLRPLSHDGLPHIGRFPRYENLAVATGHAMLGVSLAPITGRLIAQIVSGEPASIDLSLLRPDR